MSGHEKPSGFPVSPLSGIFSLAADKLGSLVGSPRNLMRAASPSAVRNSQAKNDEEDDFDIVQLEWTDSDKTNSDPQSN